MSYLILYVCVMPYSLQILALANCLEALHPEMNVEQVMALTFSQLALGEAEAEDMLMAAAIAPPTAAVAEGSEPAQGAEAGAAAGGAGEAEAAGAAGEQQGEQGQEHQGAGQQCRVQ